MATRAQKVAVTIRPAHESDLDDVAAIERAVFNDPWSRRSFTDLVNARQVLFLVATDSNSVVGYAIVLVAGPESELANLAVSRLVQQQGLGRRLLDEVLRQTQARGCKEMYLEVRASNTAAIHLYNSAGFEAVGRRARYYARPIEDAIVMRLQTADFRVQGSEQS
jgi:ribosomal-protein-alanine N-acetyltransferase